MNYDEFCKQYNPNITEVELENMLYSIFDKQKAVSASNEEVIAFCELVREKAKRVALDYVQMTFDNDDEQDVWDKREEEYFGGVTI